uniref:(northern house mosquito) hypothetical protein n=1 Tax=Culex pipiens TaxID=7175 RepID=A0A8D8MH31_CULPI
MVISAYRTSFAIWRRLFVNITQNMLAEKKNCERKSFKSSSIIIIRASVSNIVGKKASSTGTSLPSWNFPFAAPSSTIQTSMAHHVPPRLEMATIASSDAGN